MSQATDIPFEAIRERAYDLWERHHRPEGFSIELWLMAERELRAEREARGRLAEGSPGEGSPGEGSPGERSRGAPMGGEAAPAPTREAAPST